MTVPAVGVVRGCRWSQGKMAMTMTMMTMMTMTMMGVTTGMVAALFYEDGPPAATDPRALIVEM